MRRPHNLKKISHLYRQNRCFYSVASNQVGDFFKCLCPFQKNWTFNTVLHIQSLIKKRVDWTFGLLANESTKIRPISRKTKLKLGTIQILRKQVFGLLIVNKNGHF